MHWTLTLAALGCRPAEEAGPDPEPRPTQPVDTGSTSVGSDTGADTAGPPTGEPCPEVGILCRFTAEAGASVSIAVGETARQPLAITVLDRIRPLGDPAQPDAVLGTISSALLQATEPWAAPVWWAPECRSGADFGCAFPVDVDTSEPGIWWIAHHHRVYRVTLPDLDTAAFYEGPDDAVVLDDIVHLETGDLVVGTTLAFAVQVLDPRGALRFSVPPDAVSAPSPDSVAFRDLVLGASSLAAHGNWLFVADWERGVVWSVDATTWAATRLAGIPHERGTLYWNSPDGTPAIDADLWGPTVATSSTGKVYLTETESGCIRRIEEDGTLSTVAGVCDFDGTRVAATEGVGGPAVDATLSPVGGAPTVVDDFLYIPSTGPTVYRVRLADP
jgi:hypothetical protein